MQVEECPPQELAGVKHRHMRVIRAADYDSTHRSWCLGGVNRRPEGRVVDLIVEGDSEQICAIVFDFDRLKKNCGMNLDQAVQAVAAYRDGCSTPEARKGVPPSLVVFASDMFEHPHESIKLVNAGAIVYDRSVESDEGVPTVEELIQHLERDLETEVAAPSSRDSRPDADPTVYDKFPPGVDAQMVSDYIKMMNADQPVERQTGR